MYLFLEVGKIMKKYLYPNLLHCIGKALIQLNAVLFCIYVVYLVSEVSATITIIAAY